MPLGEGSITLLQLGRDTRGVTERGEPATELGVADVSAQLLVLGFPVGTIRQIRFFVCECELHMFVYVFCICFPLGVLPNGFLLIS